jgi:hypothetical protein
MTVKRWIRIRIEVMQIRNPGKYTVGSKDYKKNTHIRRTGTAVVE